MSRCGENGFVARTDQARVTRRAVAVVAVFVAVLVVGLPASAATRPAIRLVAPAHGPVGIMVTITGRHLGGARVTFGGHVGAHTTTNPAGTKVVTYLPAGMRLGPAVVKVTTKSGSAIAAAKFVVEAMP